ncbi:sel1 repeat family protein [bacterium]|nr:sel1 repeat family protein [bacterium]
MIQIFSVLILTYLCGVRLLLAGPENSTEDIYWQARKLSSGEGGLMDVPKARDLYRKAAESGDPRALAWQARRMFYGELGIPKDEETAKVAFLRVEKDLQKMANHDVPDAKRSLAFTWGTFFPATKGKQAFAMLQEVTDHGRQGDLVSLARFYEDGIGVQKDLPAAFALYRKSADQGNVGAMGSVGRCYENGIGVAKDENEAVRWYRKAAQRGNPGGAMGLGICYELGKGAEKNLPQAFIAYRQSAEGGNSWAQNKVGWWLASGIGVTKDQALAVEWYRRSADQGNEMAMGNLGFCYESGQGVGKDEKEAVRWYRKAAEKRNGWSLNQLGLCYEYGRGVEKDPAKAFEYYLQSAEAGNDWGQFHAADCYYDGRGVPQNDGQAFGWFQKSANQGNASGLSGVAACYEAGRGTKKDEKEALRLYTQASEKGNAWSMGRLAQMYEDGRGTEKNPAEAFRWWNRQAESGDFWAPEKVARCYAEGIGVPKNPEEAREQYRRMLTKLEEETKKNSAWGWDNLGRYYFHGMGVEKNHGKALECYRKAAELKSGWAMEQIGWCYEKGLGVKADDQEALTWYRKAAENGQAWSMGQVAVFCENGRGTDKNPGEAYRWFRKKSETGSGDRWADENVARCLENAIGTKKDDQEALRWYRKAADAGSLWAGEQAGRFFEEGLGVKKNPEEAYRYFLPSVQAKRPWAQYRMVSLGSSQIYEGKYDFAERCFQAAWDSGYRPGADWLHQLHTAYAAGWENADPLKGIQVQRKALRGDRGEGPGVGALAGEAFRLGYVSEASQMVQELLDSPQIQAEDEERARWHALAGYCSLAGPRVDPMVVQGRRFPETWIRHLENPPAVEMVNFNIKLKHPQTRLEFLHVGDFVAPIAPRRWASYLIQHLKWGLEIWREQKLDGFQSLALTATAGRGKGGAFLWADRPIPSTQISEEHFRMAENLSANFAARFGRAILAWKGGDRREARLALDPVQKELKEEALAADEKRKQKDSHRVSQRKEKAGWSRQVEKLAQEGNVPWGNAKGELTFGFGISGGSGLFHGQLTNACWKLVVPFVLWIKPDWMLTVADMILQFGVLSPMQMIELYESLSQKPETRAMACARLAMMQAQLGEKEKAWSWAEQAAQERPSDPEIVRMVAAIAFWAGKTEESKKWQARLQEVQVRRQLLSQESPDKEYLRIFEELHVAEQLEAQEKQGEADLKFQKALQDLKRLNENHPDWETAVVQYRIRALEKKLSPKEKQK